MNEKQLQTLSLMNDLGIYSGITEEQAESNVTRSEFAKIVVRLMGAEDRLSESPRRIFGDVPADHDAAAAIEYLYNNGVMNGYGDALFKPDSVIPLGEVMKVLISVTGYKEMAETKGGYPNGYYAVAASNNLLSGVSGGLEKQLTYLDGAMLLKNVLESKNYLVTTGYENGAPVVEKGSEEYMSHALHIYRFNGIIEAYGKTSLYSASDEYKDNTVKINGELIEAGAIDFSPYIGMKVNVYYKAEDDTYTALHVVEDSNVKTVEIQSDDILDDATKSNFRYYDGTKVKTLKIDDDAIVIYNGKRLDVAADVDVRVGNGSVRFISNTGSSSYHTVIIKEYETFIVDKVLSTDVVVNFKYDRGSLSLQEGSGLDVTYWLDGQLVDFSSIASNSVLSVAMSKNTSGDRLAEVLISNNRVTGTAKSLYNGRKKRGVVLEDGTEYNFTDEYMARIAEGQRSTYEPSLGTEGTYYIDAFNQVAGFMLSTSSKNYAYVVKCWYSEDEEDGEIRLFMKDGNFENFKLSNKMTINGQKVERTEVANVLKASSLDGTIYQLIICTTTEDGQILKIQTATNKTSENYYIASEDEFILNAFPKNNAGQPKGQRFYKNMAEHLPFTFVDGKTLQFMIPTDKSDEKAYKIATKLSSTDVSLPAPLYLYDAGLGGALGAVVSNTASEGNYGTPCIIDSVAEAVDENGDVGRLLQFVGGQSVFAGDSVIYDQPTTNWKDRVDYSHVTINDLKRGDVIEYTTSNNKIEMLRVVVRVDDVGQIRVDGDHIQRNGNIIADVISVSENGRTALVHYVDRDNVDRYQTMLINSTTYRYESSDEKVYNSSVADLRTGDRILINSYWWSPKLVVIFR